MHAVVEVHEKLPPLAPTARDGGAGASVHREPFQRSIRPFWLLSNPIATHDSRDAHQTPTSAGVAVCSPGV